MLLWPLIQPEMFLMTKKERLELLHLCLPTTKGLHEETHLPMEMFGRADLPSRELSTIWTVSSQTSTSMPPTLTNLRRPIQSLILSTPQYPEAERMLLLLYRIPTLIRLLILGPTRRPYDNRTVLDLLLDAMSTEVEVSRARSPFVR